MLQTYKIFWQALIAIGVSLFCIWQVSDMDVYWMIRAGEEILTRGKILHIEEWSYSAPGNLWIHTHWLSEVLVAVYYKFFGDTGLIWLRALTFAPICFVFLKMISPRSIWSTAIFATLFYLAWWFRLAVRADQFIILMFALMHASYSQCTKLSLRHVYLGILAIILATNLHAGSALFLVGLFAFHTFRSFGLSLEWIKYLSLAIVGTLISPAGTKAYVFAFNHFFYHSGKVLTNPDHQPFSEAHFWTRSLVGSGWATLALAVPGIAGVLISIRGAFKDQKFPEILKKLSPVAVTISLILLTFNRDRTIPFLLLFLAPYFNQLMTNVQSKAKENSKWSHQFALNATIVCLCAAILAGQSHSHTNLYPWSSIKSPGWGPDHTVFPVRATEFLAKNKTKGNLYHTYTFGAYLVYKLREHKLFGDTRETPFTHLSYEYFDAYKSPEAAQKLYERYGINALVMPIPGSPNTKQNFDDVIERYNPSDNWAIVYFDDISIVVVKRIPEHEKLIERFEFKLLKPHMSSEIFSQFIGNNFDTDARFYLECIRCKQLKPMPQYCEQACSIKGHQKKRHELPPSIAGDPFSSDEAF